MSGAFITLILVPIIGNTGEFIATVNQARKNSIDFAIGLIVGNFANCLIRYSSFGHFGWIIRKPVVVTFRYIPDNSIFYVSHSCGLSGSRRTEQLF